jgi:hypothetical protein
VSASVAPRTPIAVAVGISFIDLSFPIVISLALASRLVAGGRVCLCWEVYGRRMRGR